MRVISWMKGAGEIMEGRTYVGRRMGGWVDGWMDGQVDTGQNEGKHLLKCACMLLADRRS